MRRIPKLGIEVSPDQRREITQQLDALGRAIESLRKDADPQRLDLLTDIRIYHVAVQTALTHQEFFDAGDIRAAFELLEEGLARAADLEGGKAPWTSATGLVVRGYVSRIDGSVQPYGLVVPETYRRQGPSSFPLHLWLHGRGETLSEVKFLQQRRKQAGVFTPPDTIVLHPYGRYSNANKFAGEIDVLEALDDVRRRYRIDDDRIAVRGFSMGGASAWQLAVHYPTRWAAANPGAGFSETPEFLKSFQQQTLAPTWWEEKLWRLYDCNRWAVNLHHCPTVAYSGEVDRQKQAADVMEAAMAEKGIRLTHIIGPDTGHKYHPDSAAQVDSLVRSLVAVGRDPLPRNLHFTTFTLRYNECGWLKLDGLEEHWEEARVDGRLDERGMRLATRNVSALTLQIPSGRALFDLGQRVQVLIDGQLLTGPLPGSDRSFQWSLHRSEGVWRPGPLETPLRKRPGLQGPIDDAFLDAFLFVRPTGKHASQQVAQWVAAEMERAVVHWRRHFRGDARIKDDRDVTDHDKATMNLVLWGAPESNLVWREIADRLPIVQQNGEWVVGADRYSAETHVPLLIHPNPAAPDRYVVLNSSFTFREFAYLNNARQVPMLPDWAIVDVADASGEWPRSQWPGRIAQAGFFGENWELKSKPAK